MADVTGGAGVAPWRPWAVRSVTCDTITSPW